MALRRQAQQLRELQRQALGVTRLTWESPAGDAFRSYLSERSRNITRSIDLLEAAAGRLEEYGRLVAEAELLQRGVTP